MSIESTYSPHDGGYYAEVYNKQGQTIHQTDIYATRSQAIRAASTWIEKEFAK